MAVEMETSSLDNSFETKMKKDDDRKKLAPIVDRSKVSIKKEGLGKKIRKAFISEDMKDVGSYVFMDIIVPGIKNAVLDTLERLFFATDSRSRGRDSYDRRDRVSYASYYRSSRGDYDSNSRRKREYEDRDDDKIDYRRIVLKDREDAKKVVKSLRESVREYGSASVAALIDLVGGDSSWTDNDYGWQRETDICIRDVRGGYLIDVPEAHYIGE